MASLYLPRGVDHGDREEQLRAAFVGVPFLTPLDLVALMGGDAGAATPADVEMAEWDLRTNGYRADRVALWGCRRVFPRYVRSEVWPEDAVRFDALRAAGRGWTVG